MSVALPSRVQVVSRVFASLVGGWAFVWGSTTLAISLLVAAGVDYDEARKAIMLFAFVLFLAVFCWAFATASLARVWTVLAGGAAAMTLGAWLLVRHLAV